MKGSKLFSIILAFLIFAMSTTVIIAKDNSTITINKEVFKPGETIKLSYTTKPGLKTNAWIGIIPSEVKHGSEAENDKYDVAYQYLKGKAKGKLSFKAPAKPGKYDFRLNDTDDNGKELVSVTFTVK